MFSFFPWNLFLQQFLKSKFRKKYLGNKIIWFSKTNFINQFTLAGTLFDRKNIEFAIIKNFSILSMEFFFKIFDISNFEKSFVKSFFISRIQHRMTQVFNFFHQQHFLLRSFPCPMPHFRKNPEAILFILNDIYIYIALLLKRRSKKVCTLPTRIYYSVF